MPGGASLRQAAGVPGACSVLGGGRGKHGAAAGCTGLPPGLARPGHTGHSKQVAGPAFPGCPCPSGGKSRPLSCLTGTLSECSPLTPGVRFKEQEPGRAVPGHLPSAVHHSPVAVGLSPRELPCFFSRAPGEWNWAPTGVLLCANSKTRCQRGRGEAELPSEGACAWAGQRDAQKITMMMMMMTTTG